MAWHTDWEIIICAHTIKYAFRAHTYFLFPRTIISNGRELIWMFWANMDLQFTFLFVSTRTKLTTELWLHSTFKLEMWQHITSVFVKLPTVWALKGTWPIGCTTWLLYFQTHLHSTSNISIWKCYLSPWHFYRHSTGFSKTTFLTQLGQWPPSPTPRLWKIRNKKVSITRKMCFFYCVQLL